MYQLAEGLESPHYALSPLRYNLLSSCSQINGEMLHTLLQNVLYEEIISPQSHLILRGDALLCFVTSSVLQLLELLLFLVLGLFFQLKVIGR